MQIFSDILKYIKIHQVELLQQKARESILKIFLKKWKQHGHERYKNLPEDEKLMKLKLKLIIAELHLRHICNEVLWTKKLILLHKFKELVFKQV